MAGDGATFPRVHVWADDEDVYAPDLNAEFDNILNNFSFEGEDDYSLNVAQMQIQTTPGGVGTESLATSGAGELARLRFVLARLTGQTYWYDAPALSISDINSLLNSGIAIPPNRIASGRVAASANQAMSLVPSGAAPTVTLKATATNLVYYVAGVRYSATADFALSGLTTAPAANNTALVNDTTLSGSVTSQLQGEYGTTITIDSVGTEISNLVGKFAAFKIVHSAVTEYFIAFVQSSTQLTKAMRGCFFNSSDAAIPRIGVSDEDVITLMKLTHIFVKTDGTLDFTYNSPIYSTLVPSSPSTGDFWFDMTTLLWKRYSGTAFVASGSTLLGVCIQDATNTVAARTFEYFFVASSLNTLQFDLASTTMIRGNALGQNISVLGNKLEFKTNLVGWSSAGQFATGVTLTASTTYYLYVSDKGQQFLDIIAPHDRTTDLQGFYHPSYPWRAVGYFTTDGGSLFQGTTSYGMLTQSQINSRPYRTDQPIGGVATSGRAGGSGNASTSSTSPIAVGDCVFSLQTKGSPVIIGLKGYDSTAAYVGVDASGGGTRFVLFTLQRDGVTIASCRVSSGASGVTQVPPGAVTFLDVPPAGTHSYSLLYNASDGASVARAVQIELYGYELT